MTPAIGLFILAAILVRMGVKNQGFVDAALARDTTKATGNVPAGGDFSGGGDFTGDTGSLEAEADRMVALRQPYKWGGGHSGFDPDGPWDCSGAISWLLHYLGLLEGRPMTSVEFMAHGQAGRGADFTVYASVGHVFIKMESGPRAGQCFGTTRRIASQGGSLRWHQHITAGFVPRHYGESRAGRRAPGSSPSSPRRRLP